MASMKPILTDLIKKGKKLIYTIRDSLSYQYQNKKILWLASHFPLEYEIELRWIYLESRHGKGSQLKVMQLLKTIKDTISYNPDIPIYYVLDLLIYGLQDCIPSINLYNHKYMTFWSFKIKYHALKE